MTARILVVDDIEANLKVLEAKLSREYYTVLTARDGLECLQVAKTQSPDLILLDVMMPNMNGFDACAALKADPETKHIPVVLVTALGAQDDRIQGLNVGADDFLTKPPSEAILMARVKSLTRLKMLVDELRQREASGRKLGVIEEAATLLSDRGGRVLIVDDNARHSSSLATDLTEDQRPVIEADVERARQMARGIVDVVVVNTTSDSFDGLRFLAQLRADEGSRHVPILAVVEDADEASMVRALELGATDLLIKRGDRGELLARVRTQVLRKRYTDMMRAALDQGLELAVTDPLTGLNNRRYMTNHLSSLVRRSSMGDDPVSVLVIDIDFFKRVNDTLGHDAGDEVLREFALRLATNVRAIDLPCRFGGEEFVVVMPGAGIQDAARIAERLRMHVASTPFKISSSDEPLSVTISVGVATTLGEGDTPDGLLKRADEAVYEAKRSGRNRVVVNHVLAA